MSTTLNFTTITLNFYGREDKVQKDWKKFVIEKLMCSPDWPAEVQLLRPTLRGEELKPADEEKLVHRNLEIEKVYDKLLSEYRGKVFSKNDFINLNSRIAKGGYFGQELRRLRDFYFTGDGGCVFTFIYQSSSNPPSPHIQMGYRRREGSRRIWEERGWYERLKMLWKGNMIEPRWDAKTQKNGNGEREFIVKKYQYVPPNTIRGPMELEDWEKKFLVDETPSIVEEVKATGIVLYDEAMKKGGKFVDEARIQALEKFTGLGNRLEDAYRGWGQRK